MKLPQTRKPAFVLIFYCFLAVILRLFSFFPSVIDHDESTYLEIARMVLEGKTLYVDMIDIKPPGIFLVLAGFEWLSAYSILVIRLLVAIWIALTAFMVYRVAKILVNDHRASFAAGMIYIFLLSTWSFYGISITPEIFFNLFTIMSLWVMIRYSGKSRFFLAGLLAGLGFIVKYLVLFDFAAIFLFILYSEIRNQKSAIRNVILPVTLAGFGFAIPFLSMNLWYMLNGHFDALYNIVYLAPSKYPAAFDAWKMLKFILDFNLRFFPVFFFFYYFLLNKNSTGNSLGFVRRLGLVWSILALAAVMIAGKTFGHYTIELMLPVSLLAGMFFHSESKMPWNFSRLLANNWGKAILLVLVLSICLMKIEYVTRKDVPCEVADYLRPKLKADDVIYTGNYHHIIYYLLNKDSPTKYVHRSLLIEPNHIRALNINVDAEFRHIMHQEPAYIIVQRAYPAGMMRDYISEHYVVDKEFGDNVLVYKRDDKKVVVPL